MVFLPAEFTPLNIKFLQLLHIHTKRQKQRSDFFLLITVGGTAGHRLGVGGLSWAGDGGGTMERML